MGLLDFKVKESNTYFLIYDFDKKTYSRLKQFCLRNLALWAKVPGPTYGSHRYEISHIFATFTRNKTELRISKGFYNQLIEFMAGVDYQGTHPTITKIPETSPKRARFKWRNKTINPRNQEQEDYIQFLLRSDKPLVVLNASTGRGKALRNDTLVQTPSGWTPIGELKEGDEVIAADGTVTIVTGVYPQGELPYNEVIFGDGRKRYCCNEHQWKVWDSFYHCESILNTYTIRKRLLGNKPVSVPLIQPYGDWEVREKKLLGVIDEKTQCLVTDDEEYARNTTQLAWSLGRVASHTVLNEGQNVVYVGNKHEQGYLPIVDVKPHGVAPCTCISVAHPDKLFVVEDYIPTHNTVMSIIAFFRMGYRVLISVLPKFVSIWVTSLNRFLRLTPDDVINISDFNLNDVYDAFRNNRVNPKIVFFQLTRINTYIKRQREEPHSIPPLDDFFDALGAGVRVIDEAHESIYMVYSSLLFGNFKKNIGISATLYHDSEFINKIYKGTFTPDAYLKPPTYDKYINVVSYYHRMNNRKYRINTKGFGGYNHAMYENGIMRNRKIFENYYQMCRGAFERFYIQGKREGQKAMWFFSTIAMGERFVNRLKKDYPTLDIFLFAGDILKKKGMENEYQNHEVVVTTPGSCSTGKDVAMLYVVFCGVSVSSSQRLEQMSGRTRPIHEWWPDLDPIFLTFVCRDIQKQLEYDRKKKSTIANKTKKFTSVESGFIV